MTKATKEVIEMAKYKHQPDTLTALNDIKNRLHQLIEVNNRYKGVGHDDKMIDDQNQGHQNAITIVDQVIKTGHVFRGSWAVPDPVEPMATTKFNGVALAPSTPPKKENPI